MKTNTEIRTGVAANRKGILAALAAIAMALVFATSAFAVIDPGSAATGQNNAAGAETLTINKPATTNTGDVLLAQITFHTGVTATIVPPPGWTEVIRTNNSFQLGQAIYTKVAGPSEPISYTWQFSSGATRAAGGIANYFGVDQNDPVGDTDGATGNDAAPIAPSVDAEDSSRLVLSLGAREVTTITAPGGFTFRFLQRQPLSGELTVRAEDRSRNAGPTGVSASTMATSTFWVAQHIILRNDATPPSVVITSTESNPTANSPIPITVQFSEPVNGFDSSDVVVTNGTVGDFTGTFTDTFFLNVTPSAAGEVTVNIAAGVATDAAGNANTVAPQFAITFDSNAPTVTISSSSSESTSVSPIPIAVQFSEDVTGFEQADVQVTNGTIGDFAGTGASYTFNITPTAPGEVTVNIPAGVAQDGSATGNIASAPFSRIFTLADTTGPTVTISSESEDPTSDSPIPVTIKFSELVSGFVAADIAVTNGTVSSFSTLGGDTYLVNVTPSAAGEVTVNVAAGVAQDTAGNGNQAAAPFAITYVASPTDTTGPTVTINQASGQADPTTTSPIRFTVLFNEPVNGFTNSDVTLGGTAGATTAVVTQVAPNNGTTYEVAVSGMTGSGTVTASIAAGAVTDAAGNPNQASTSTDNTVTFNEEGGGGDEVELLLPYVERQ